MTPTGLLGNTVDLIIKNILEINSKESHLQIETVILLPAVNVIDEGVAIQLEH